MREREGGREGQVGRNSTEINFYQLSLYKESIPSIHPSAMFFFVILYFHVYKFVRRKGAQRLDLSDVNTKEGRLIFLLHRTLVSAFPDAALGVSVGVDGVVFQSDVYAASNSGTLPKRHVRNHWGDRAVLILVGIRLGLDGVNPIYYDSIKVGGVTT